jgi:hypothetical protein
MRLLLTIYLVSLVLALWGFFGWLIIEEIREKSKASRRDQSIS